jgi:hypothetical protein
MVEILPTKMEHLVQPILETVVKEPEEQHLMAALADQVLL